MGGNAMTLLHTDPSNYEKVINSLNKLTQQITDLDNRLSALENDRSPDSFHNKLQFFGTTLEEHTNKICEIEFRLNANDNDDSLVEDFTLEQLKRWYDKSGLQITDVQNFMKDNVINGNFISANDVLNGMVNNKTLVSKLGKWFRTRAIKRNTGSGL
jgi:hypothetical protein